MDNEKNMYNDFFDKKQSDNNSRKKVTIIIIVVFALIALGITAYFIFKDQNSNKKNNTNTNNAEASNNKVARNIKFEDDLNYDENSTDTFIYIYKVKDHDVYYATKTYGHIDDNGVSVSECELVKKYKCSSAECKVKGNYEQFIIKDEDLHFTYNAAKDIAVDTNTEIVIYQNDNFKIGIYDSKYFYVNGKKVDFYSEVNKIRNNYQTEEQFYSYSGSQNYFSFDYNGVKMQMLMSITYNYEVIDDIIYVSVISAYNVEDHFDFFIDKDGKIIKMIGNREEDINLSGEYDLLDKVEGKEMYFNVSTDYLLQHSKEIPYCDKKDKNELSDVATIVDKVTYLGDGEFSVEKNIKTITYEELGKDIDCSMVGIIK